MVQMVDRLRCLFFILRIELGKEFVKGSAAHRVECLSKFLGDNFK